jgi:hypothetical protein
MAAGQASSNAACSSSVLALPSSLQAIQFRWRPGVQNVRQRQDSGLGVLPGGSHGTPEPLLDCRLQQASATGKIRSRHSLVWLSTNAFVV